MGSTYITTVGTSLLTNFGWKRGQELPQVDEVLSWLGAANRAVASAETHSWLLLGAFDEDADDRIILVHSDTDQGKFCAGVLEEWLKSCRVVVTSELVVNLGKPGEKPFRLGLHKLVQKLFACIKVAVSTGRSPQIVATGGFKAEIAYANTVGMLTDTPVHYTYEGFEHMVTLEPLPLQWRRDAFDGVRELLMDLDQKGAQPRARVASWLPANPHLGPLLEEMSDDEIGLSPVGDIVVKLLETEVVPWPTPSNRAPAEKVRIEGVDHHRPDGWKAALDEMANVPYVVLIRYNGANSKPTSSIWITDAEKGTLGGVMVGSKGCLGLTVETTARGSAQCELLAAHLRRLLKWK